MKSAFTILLLTVSVLYRAECVCGKTLNDMVQEWQSYQEDCLRNISSEPVASGVFCRRMFDMYACWTDGMPNTTVKVPCPWYLPWYDQVSTGFVTRECGPDGRWHTVNTSHTWRDHSQCDFNSSDLREQENQILVLVYFRVMYTVGYSLSLASLSLAVIILLLFRKLRCTRNYIHTNLFTSFILRAVSVLMRDALLPREMPEFRDDSDVPVVLNEQALSACHVAQVMMQYCVGANYLWLLVEGLYLHNLLVLMVFSEQTFFWGYLLIGWGTPIFFVVPWIVVRSLYENTMCWEVNENLGYWWIIRTPILLAILVNFFIFIRIIQILVSKLKAHQMRYTDYKFRLAKSTLTLIPLLGIHEVVFAVVTEEQTEGIFRSVSLFFHLFCSSFQGFLVAILYCFVNKEVQSEIKKKWQRWKLGMSILDEQRTTGSNTAQGFKCPHEPPCQRDCPERHGSTEGSDPPPASAPPSTQRHHHPKKGKAYCYISGRKQGLNGFGPPALDHARVEGAIGYCESYC
ncbi:gastric inhibitory polypeptide receptor isoform X2 [Brachyhypopomus gauderio]|uniref:gastric inhibitory polypeptide receptor isoform X2 n=1 Tax=Brachyhypopomus gauderio TaxID=698409 RepID=UPI0040436460